MANTSNGYRGYRLVCSVLVAALAASGAVSENASATGLVTPPDAVTIPEGLNLGDTSFFDAFAPAIPGAFGLIDYLKYQDLTEITTSSGRSNPAFNTPHINAAINILQGAYDSSIPMPHGVLGFMVLQPIVNFNSHFDTPGVVLRDNGLGFGDTSVGTFYQSLPFFSGGRPVFAFRTEFDVSAPSGSFDKMRDLNQSSGYWSIIPYVALTILPTPRLEISSRIQYLYNFRTDQASNPPPVPGFQFQNGQAGQAVFLNFDSSYAIAPWLNLGVNGFYLKQFTNDAVNGFSLAGTEKQELYLGPGAHIPFGNSNTNFLNVNAYFPVESRGLPQGPQLNAQFIHVF